MKILLISDYGTLAGGAEVTSMALRDGMRARGHEVRLFTSSAGAADQQNFADVTCFGTTGRARTALQCLNPSAYSGLKRQIRSFRPDVVHVKMFLTQLSPAILPLIRGVPALYHAEWYRSACLTGTKMLPSGLDCKHHVGTACLSERCVRAWDWPLLMGQTALLRRWIGLFDNVVPISLAVAEVLHAEGIHTTAPIPTGVPVLPQRLLMSAEPRVVFAGRLVVEKGVDLLLRAMATLLPQLPTASLLIAGDGPERQRLESLAVELGITHAVHFSGRVLPAELEARAADAWVQIVCSRWAEPFGIVAIEAMMRGVAVIASEGGGLGELVEPGRTGLRVARGSVDDLAGAMLQILSDRSRAAAMGEAGRRRALAEYSQDTMVHRFETLYGEMVRAGKRSLAESSCTRPAPSASTSRAR
jgi:glycosyltransferase involved in cell wall biosynthesis